MICSGSINAPALRLMDLQAKNRVLLGDDSKIQSTPQPMAWNYAMIVGSERQEGK
jgi:hypothetical protein